MDIILKRIAWEVADLIFSLVTDNFVSRKTFVINGLNLIMFKGMVDLTKHDQQGREKPSLLNKQTESSKIRIKSPDEINSWSPIPNPLLPGWFFCVTPRSGYSLIFPLSFYFHVFLTITAHLTSSYALYFIYLFSNGYCIAFSASLKLRKLVF